MLAVIPAPRQLQVQEETTRTPGDQGLSENLERSMGRTGLLGTERALETSQGDKNARSNPGLTGLVLKTRMLVRVKGITPRGGAIKRPHPPPVCQAFDSWQSPEAAGLLPTVEAGRLAE